MRIEDALVYMVQVIDREFPVEGEPTVVVGDCPEDFAARWHWCIHFKPGIECVDLQLLFLWVLGKVVEQAQVEVLLAPARYGIAWVIRGMEEPDTVAKLICRESDAFAINRREWLLEVLRSAQQGT